MAEAKDSAARFVEAFNSHNESAIRAFYADNVKLGAPGFKVEGPEAATKHAMGWLNGFPDGRMTVENTIACDSWIVQEVVMEGTNTGVLEGPAGSIQPTVKHRTLKGASIVRYQDGLIVSVNLYYDQLEMLTQLGLKPAPALAAV